jgi:hypothetical protein
VNKRISVVLFGLLLALLSGCMFPGDHFVKRTDKVQQFKLVTVGEPGQHFTGKLKLDGVEQEISGVSPAQFPLEACVLTGTIRKTHGDGTLRFQILVGSATLGFGNLTGPGDSCRFRYHANGIEVWQK